MLELPATPQQVLEHVIVPGLALLPKQMDSRRARILVLTIMMQESALKYRAQVLNGGGKGPARGLAQFERGGGVKGVLEHPASAKLAEQVCKARGIVADRATVWAAMETDDLLSAAFSRLLLYTDPAPLPADDDAESAWRYYLRVWRPGAAKRDYDGLHAKFLRNHAKARAAA